MVEEIHLGKSFKAAFSQDWLDFGKAFDHSKQPVFIKINQPGSKYHDSIFEITPTDGSSGGMCLRDRSNLPKNQFFNPTEWWQVQYHVKTVRAWWTNDNGMSEFMALSLQNKDFIWLKGYTGPTLHIVNDTKKSVPLYDKLGQPIVAGELCVVGGPEPAFAVVTKTQGQYAYVKRIVGGYDSEIGHEKKVLKLTNIFMIADDLKSKIMLEKLKKAI